MVISEFARIQDNTAQGGGGIGAFNQPVPENNFRGESMATTTAPTKPAQTNEPARAAQLRVTRRSPAYWRVTIDNPPLNVMGPELVREVQDGISYIESA